MNLLPEFEISTPKRSFFVSLSSLTLNPLTPTKNFQLSSSIRPIMKYDDIKTHIMPPRIISRRIIELNRNNPLRRVQDSSVWARGMKKLENCNVLVCLMTCFRYSKWCHLECRHIEHVIIIRLVQKMYNYDSKQRKSSIKRNYTVQNRILSLMGIGRRVS